MLPDPTTVTICFLALMAILFLFDFGTSFSPGHRDFRSIIVRIGVLGTFTGVFIGLTGFDAGDISGSVPRLLEGMKIAFLTSVVGMGLSVFLSILNRLRDNRSGEDETTLLATISDKLDKLDQLADLERLREEVHHSSLMQEEQFATINQTIADSMQQLSRSASEEIVKSLERVISDFNSNLTEQFGDNFTALNEGIARMLQWQENHRDTTEASARLLQEINHSLQHSEQTLHSVASRNEETLAVYNNLADIIVTQKRQSDTLQKQMEQYAKLARQASAGFTSMQTGFVKVQASMEAQSASVARLTDDIARQLPESLNELENTLAGLTNKFARDYRSFLDRYRSLVMDVE